MKIAGKFGRQAFVVAGILALCLSVDASAGEVDADAAKAFAKESNCFRCHGIDKDKASPGFNKIAAKFKGKADAESKLITHLTTGPKVKFLDGHEENHLALDPGESSKIKNLVDWILSL